MCIHVCLGEIISRRHGSGPTSQNNQEKGQKHTSTSRAMLSANNQFTSSHFPANTKFTSSSKCSISKGTKKGSSSCKGTNSSKSSSSYKGTKGFKLSTKHIFITSSILW